MSKDFIQKLIEKMPVLKKKLSGLIKNEQVLEDVVQDTIHKILLDKRDYNLIKDPDSWFLIIARNQWYNLLKRDAFVKVKPDFSEGSELENMKGKVNDYIPLLNSFEQDLISYKYLRGYSIKEISTLFRLPEGSIKRKLYFSRKKLKESIMSVACGLTPPEVIVDKRKCKEIYSIKKSGYGICEGSPAFGKGDIEVVECYEYPGRIFSYRNKALVTGKYKIMGHDVWGVKNTYDNRKGEKERIQYFSLTEDKIAPVLRIINLDNELLVETEKDDLMPEIFRSLSTNDYKDKSDGLIFQSFEIADVTIKNKKYENCICSVSCFEDFHGLCYDESYLSSDGRTILERTYIGENWQMGGYVSFEKWEGAPEITCEGNRFRLWTEFILVDNYFQKL